MIICTVTVLSLAEDTDITENSAATNDGGETLVEGKKSNSSNYTTEVEYEGGHTSLSFPPTPPFVGIIQLSDSPLLCENSNQVRCIMNDLFKMHH